MMIIQAWGVQIDAVLDAQAITPTHWIVLARIVHATTPYVIWDWDPTTETLSHPRYFVLLREAEEYLIQRLANGTADTAD